VKHLEKISYSPINKEKLTPFLTCEDYTVSGDNFTIFKDSINELLITSPRPKKDDLAKYYQSDNYISHTDANVSLFDKTYQFVKKIAIVNKVKKINNYKKGDKLLLDIGCGTGEFLLACKKNGWNCIGVEPNQKARTIADSKLNSSSLVKENIDELIKTYYQKFDVITMWHVLEHVSDLNEYILILKKLLKPNGILLVAVPNFRSFDANYYGKYWAAYDVPRHLWHFSKNSIRLLFEKKEMKLIKWQPMYFDSFYVSLLSEKYKNSKNKLLKAFFIGVLSNCKGLITKEYSSHIYFIKNAK